MGTREGTAEARLERRAQRALAGKDDAFFKKVLAKRGKINADAFAPKKGHPNPIKSLDKDSALFVRNVVDVEMRSIAEAMGLKSEVGKVSYMHDGTSATLTLTFRIPQVKDGVEMTLGQINWDKYAEVMGLKPRWFGKKVRFGTKELKVVGINPRKRTKPVMLADREGKQYITTVQQTVDAFKLARMK